MAEKALFITVKELKEKSIINGVLDSNKVTQFIEVAQDVHVQNYLGGVLYKKLMSLLIDGTINDAENSDYKTLWIDYVKPMSIWFTQATYLPYSMYQVGNGGVFKYRSENGDAVDKSELDFLIQKTRDTADYYARRFTDYICMNSSLFAEYTSSHQGEVYPDKDVNFTGGWYI